MLLLLSAAFRFALEENPPALSRLVGTHTPVALPVELVSAAFSYRTAVCVLSSRALLRRFHIRAQSQYPKGSRKSSLIG